MDVLTPIVIAVLSLIGTLSGSYFANKKSTALITYRLDELEKRVDQQNHLLERVHKLEENYLICSEILKMLKGKVERLEGGADDGK